MCSFIYIYICSLISAALFSMFDLITTFNMYTSLVREFLVPTISRLLKIIGLVCRISSLL